MRILSVGKSLNKSVISFLNKHEIIIDHINSPTEAIRQSNIKHYAIALLGADLSDTHRYIKLLNKTLSSPDAIVLYHDNDRNALAKYRLYGAKEAVPYDVHPTLLLNILMDLGFKRLKAPHIIATFGALEINVITLKTYVHSIDLRLSPNQLKVMKLLFKNRYNTVTYQDVMSTLPESFDDIRKSSMLIYVIKQRIKETGSDYEYIESVPGIGFRLIDGFYLK